MKIEITKIPDINKNINKAKENLGNKVIENISPLLDEFYVSKSNESKKLNQKLKDLRKQVIYKKNSLEEKMKDLSKKKKIKTILEKISKLITAGLAYDPSFKNEVIVLLKVLDNLSTDKLNFHLKEITSMINKRFS